jgi:catechol 2,3-dioxygenase-like lactoylglutathione lyase family enzyme
MTGFDQQVTFLLVADLEASTQFYQGRLGLEQVLDQGDCRIFRITATSFLGVCQRAQQADPGSVLVTLVTDDVDGTHASLTAAGVACERTPQVNDTYNVYHAFYRDPDGFLIEVQRFLDPSWPRVQAESPQPG